MSAPLSTIGIIHTLISVVPLVSGLMSFSRYRAITPDNGFGKVYFASLVASLLSSLSLSATPLLANPVIILGNVAILAVLAGWYLIPRLTFLGSLRLYLGPLAISFSFLLLGIPTLNEGLSRLPPANPIGAGPTSAPVQNAILAWAVIWLCAVIWQMWHLHRAAPGQASGG